MFSTDNGATWDINHELFVSPFVSEIKASVDNTRISSIRGTAQDIGYPSTVETCDGSLLTVFYAHLSEYEPAVVLQQKWRLEQ